MSSNEMDFPCETVLICHEEEVLDRIGLARWLSSFTQLKDLIVIRESKSCKLKRVWREFKRVGMLRFVDVIAMRCYYSLFLASKDRAWEQAELAKLCKQYPELKAQTVILYTKSPNSSETEQLLKQVQPHMIIARCKHLLSERIFSLAAKGTWVMHPGICPEYRNAHGCFWALASGDLGRVGMTLLRVDKGIDTGPVYGFYSYPFDELAESYMVITHKVVMENLSALKTKLLEIYEEKAKVLDTSGRASKVWGQPWLTSFFAWQSAAKKRRNSK